MAVDTKKEQERDELHRAIWAIADELRGAVDGWDFKNYVLGTMFYRYISENLTAYVNGGEVEAGNTDFDYAMLSDADAEEAREGLVEEKGFFILPSELFCNVRSRAASDENLNETLERVFRNIEDSAKGSQSEGSFAGLFDDFDVNSNKLGSTVAKRNERLVKLLDGVGAMNLGSVKDHDIDAFGDAYEYLMTMYASNAGKSGGEFFTPADVSELLTRLGTVGKKTVNKVYDPACGSGSLLLKAEKVLGKEAVINGFYGQEINITTAWLGDEEIAISGHTAIISHNQNAKYLSYYFHTAMFFNQKKKLAHGTMVIEVTPSKLGDIEIFLPTIEEQERIVGILDRFDSLCNSIAEGIPAEIDARQKQYEYYRDKLLSFQKMN